jgi:ribosomal protein S18 acetylase RimI-like enzyme
MEIREGGPDDAEALCDLTATVWRAAYVDVLGEETVEEHLAAWYDTATVRSYFGEPAVSVYVAGDPVVGYAFSRHDEAGDRLHLPAIYVHPDRWGEGIGSLLLDRVETEARDLGVETVDLVVLAENSVGRGFYEGHGYERVRERGERVDDGVRELVYEKPIA